MNQKEPYTSYDILIPIYTLLLCELYYGLKHMNSENVVLYFDQKSYLSEELTTLHLYNGSIQIKNM